MGAADLDRRGSRPRAPGLLYGASSLVVLLLLAVVALTARQQPPPAIAELSPQAVEQIKDAPAQQTSEFGSGEGGTGAGTGVTTTTTTTAPAGATTTQPVIDKARVRRCIGDPPRQIEDPQSPPCVPFWEGDNGGSTAKGVTRDTIRVVVPDWYDKYNPALETFFNSRFEFYGRKLDLINTKEGWNSTDNTPENMRAHAETADKVHDAFASASIIGTVNGRPYYDELARRGIISTTSEMIYSEADLRARHPYVWTYPMSVDDTLAALGTWTCARLKNGNARFAGAPRNTQPRHFGVIVATPFRDDPIDDSPLIDHLRGCGIEPEVKRFDRETAAANAETNVVLQLSQANVNSVVCICPELEFQELGKASTGAGYYPEWILSTYYRMDVNLRLKLYGTPDHLSHTFGLTMIPRQIKLPDAPSWYAGKEGDPNFNEGGQWHGAVRNEMYRALLILASGIQMAGPNLTPETFAAGLQRTTFPNPEHFTMPGRVGFQGDHTMTDDVAEWWYDVSATSPYGDDGPGSMCYVDRGSRRSITEFPTGDEALFAPPCDSGG